MRHTRTHTKKMEKEIRKSVSLFYFFPPFSLVLQRQTVKSSSPAGLRKKKKEKKRVGLKSQTAALISHGAISKLVTDGMCWDQARPGLLQPIFQSVDISIRSVVVFCRQLKLALLFFPRIYRSSESVWAATTTNKTCRPFSFLKKKKLECCASFEEEE